MGAFRSSLREPGGTRAPALAPRPRHVCSRCAAASEYQCKVLRLGHLGCVVGLDWPAWGHVPGLAYAQGSGQPATISTTRGDGRPELSIACRKERERRTERRTPNIHSPHLVITDSAHSAHRPCLGWLCLSQPHAHPIFSNLKPRATHTPFHELHIHTHLRSYHRPHPPSVTSFLSPFSFSGFSTTLLLSPPPHAPSPILSLLPP